MSKRRIPPFLYLLALIVLVLSIWAGFFYFVVRESRALARTTDELRLEQEKERDAQMLSNLLAKTQGERARLDSYFIKEDDAADFLERIETLATSSRVAITVTNFEKVSNENVLRLSFKGQGSFANLYRLLREIETIPLRIVVESLSLQAVDGGWSGIFIIRLESFLPKES